MELEGGQIYRSSDDHRLDIVKVGENGGVYVRLYAHRSSDNCKVHGWVHNGRFFYQWLDIKNDNKFRDSLTDYFKKRDYKLVEK